MNFQERIKFNSLNFLVAVNVIVFLVALLIQFLLGRIDNELFELLGGLSTYDVRYEGDLWLLVTSNFFHIDPFHFILNIYALYRIGKIVQNFYGDKTLFFVYILGGLGGALMTLFIDIFYWETAGAKFGYSLGASGAVFALLGLLVGGAYKKNRYGFDLPFTVGDLMPIIVISFLLVLFPDLRINHWAHFGGLLVGFILGIVFNHSLNPFTGKVEKTIKNVLYWISLLIFTLSFISLILVFTSEIFL